VSKGYSKKKYEEMELHFHTFLTCALNIVLYVASMLGCFTTEEDCAVVIECEMV